MDFLEKVEEWVPPEVGGIYAIVDPLMARATRWSGAARLTGRASAGWGLGEDSEACAVEVLFADDAGDSYVVYAVGPSPTAAVAAAEEEARRRLGCDSATAWRVA